MRHPIPLFVLSCSLVLSPAPVGAAEQPHELPAGMTTYYMGLLLRGPKWTPEVTAETEELQRRHLAHIDRMAESGRLVIAGPFLDDHRIRGILVFKTESLEEAEDLARQDPAVQAGRLVVEMHPWMVAEGILP